MFVLFLFLLERSADLNGIVYRAFILLLLLSLLVPVGIGGEWRKERRAVCRPDSDLLPVILSALLIEKRRFFRGYPSSRKERGKTRLHTTRPPGVLSGARKRKREPEKDRDERESLIRIAIAFVWHPSAERRRGRK